MDNLKLDITVADNPPRTIIVPSANPADQNEGWTLDYDFVSSIVEKINEAGGYSTGVEETEAVILALCDLPIPASPESLIPND